MVGDQSTYVDVCNAALRAAVPLVHATAGGIHRPISVHRLCEMPIQSCGQSVSARRGKAGASLNAHPELRAKRQRSARGSIYRNRPIQNKHSIDVQSPPPHPLFCFELAFTLQVSHDPMSVEASTRPTFNLPLLIRFSVSASPHLAGKSRSDVGRVLVLSTDVQSHPPHPLLCLR